MNDTDKALIERVAGAMWAAIRPAGGPHWEQLDEKKEWTIKQEFRLQAEAAVKEIGDEVERLIGLIIAVHNSLTASEQPFYVGMSLLKAEVIAAGGQAVWDAGAPDRAQKRQELLRKGAG